MAARAPLHARPLCRSNFGLSRDHYVQTTDAENLEDVWPVEAEPLSFLFGLYEGIQKHMQGAFRAALAYFEAGSITCDGYIGEGVRVLSVRAVGGGARKWRGRFLDRSSRCVFALCALRSSSMPFTHSRALLRAWVHGG
jgi:hypothetical protein